MFCSLCGWRVTSATDVSDQGGCSGVQDISVNLRKRKRWCCLVALLGRAVSIFFFFSAFFFGVAQAFKRRFSSGISYFSVFLLPILLRFWGSTILERGDYAREICYFVVVRASVSP